jgi:hypothetical protein
MPTKIKKIILPFVFAQMNAVAALVGKTKE